jgi:proline dehydrogenase
MNFISSIFTPLLSPFSRRFVAGKTAETAIAAARKVNAQGSNAILDFLGEDVTSADGAKKAADEYVRLLQLIHEHEVRAAISLKVSQMGILLSRDICIDNLRRISGEAARLKLFVWFDMEGSALTQKTIEVFDAIRQEYKDVGLCLQADLVRTGGDLDQLVRNPLNVRICKGAYKEPPTIAYASKAAVDGSFRMLVQKTLEQTSRGVYPAFATHDPALIDFAKEFAGVKHLSKDRFEFQMLYGIQNQRLAALAKEGFRTSIYIPYGTHWLPYFIRRLRERKENIYFLLRNVIRI